MNLSTESIRPKLRRGFLLSCAVALGTGIGGFYGGVWWEKYEAQKIAEHTVTVLTLSQQAQNLYLLQRVLDDLRAGRTLDGETKLLRYAKVQVNPTRECQRSTECAFWAGSLMPSEARLTELAAMPERK